MGDVIYTNRFALQQIAPGMNLPDNPRTPPSLAGIDVGYVPTDMNFEDESREPGVEFSDDAEWWNVYEVTLARALGERSWLTVDVMYTGRQVLVEDEDDAEAIYDLLAMGGSLVGGLSSVEMQYLSDDVLLVSSVDDGKPLLHVIRGSS